MLRAKRRQQAGTQLTDLPYTVFFDIVSLLPPRDALRCRRLSTAARRALTRSDLCISLALLHFPRSAEGRLLRRLLRGDDHAALAAGDWAAVFARLARRYFHLGKAMPWRVTKARTLRCGGDGEGEGAGCLRGVTPWNRFLRLEGKTAPFHYWDPAWTFAPRDGLLVYPAQVEGRRPRGGSRGQQKQQQQQHSWMPYRARDLATRREVVVPFDVAGRVVRRVRLSDGILVFEWCEEQAYHALNAQEAAHRHFATAYDVTRLGPSPEIPQLGADARGCASWDVSFRSEWKIHYLGLPLSQHDRFFSTHNRTHYVVYIWQPTRSPWGEENPLERLIIWEIGEPSGYRPSEDPNERSKPPPGTSAGPRIVRRLINDELDAWGVRQRDTPSLRGLALDARTWDEATRSACGHVFFIEEEHRWEAGPHSNLVPPRIHRVWSTGIPLQGDGPRWLDDCGGRGNGNGGDGNGSGDDDNSPFMGFCWRGPRNRRGSSRNRDAYEEEEEEETWPGRAPCWRHEDFPYLTVSEVLDAAAGVRISARQCFMLETLSVHIRPRLRVQGVEPSEPSPRRKSNSSGPSASPSSSSSSSDSSSRRRSYKRRGRRRRQPRSPGLDDGGGVGAVMDFGPGARAEGPDGEEVQFADEVWEQLLGKGFICGDERWLVGEDGDGDVTILEF